MGKEGLEMTGGKTIHAADLESDRGDFKNIPHTHFSKDVPVFYTSIMNYGLVYRSKRKSRPSLVILLAIIAILALISAMCHNIMA